MILNVLDPLPPATNKKLLYLIACDQIFLGQYNKETQEYDTDIAVACFNLNDIFCPGADADTLDSIEEINLFHETYEVFGDFHVYAWGMLKRPGSKMWRNNHDMGLYNEMLTYIQNRWVK